MENWKVVRNKYKRVEMLGIALVIICVITGIICDYTVDHGFILHGVSDINTFSLTLLQMQATVSTLTIALVALMSGNISETYMGVTISNYFLNIRPTFLKQKVIIYLSISILGLNVFFHVWKAYNVVISLFAVTILLVLISVYEIYELFKGNGIVKDEIKKYVYYVLDRGKDYQSKKVIIEDFVKEWKESGGKQSKVEYEEFFKIFLYSIEALFQYKSDEAIDDISKICVAEVHCLLNSEKDNVKERGISFIQSVYEKMFELTRDGKCDRYTFKVEFNVLGEVLQDFESAMETISISSVENSLRWNDLSDDVARVCFCLHSNSDDKKEFPELFAVYQFSRNIGHYLGKQKLANNNAIIDVRYWGKMLKNMYLTSVYNVPEKLGDKFLDHKCLLYFNYCYGLIHNGYANIIKENVFYDSMSRIWNINNKYEAKFFLLLYCYLYYLGEKENQSCISKILQDEVKELMEDEGVRNRFNSFIYSVSEANDIINSQLEKDIYNILSGFESFPKYSNCKTMIMEDTVCDFYVFLMLYIENEYYIPEICNNAFGEDFNTIISYQCHFLGINEQNTKIQLKRFYFLVDVSKKSDEEIDCEVDLMYMTFNDYVTTVYKKCALKEAEKNQKQYEEKIDQKTFNNNIKKRIASNLNDIFNNIIINKVDKQSTKYKLHLFRFNYLTETLEEKSINGFFSNINSTLVDNICRILKEREVVEVRKRNSFANDLEYIQYLENADIEILMGSQYTLKNTNYKLSDEFKQFASKCLCIYTGFGTNGIALKKNSMKIYIHKIDVTLHDLTFSEVAPEYDSNTNQYIYEIRTGVVARFEKEELVDFLHNQRKILDVYVTISIQNSEDVGVIIERK